MLLPLILLSSLPLSLASPWFDFCDGQVVKLGQRYVHGNFIKRSIGTISKVDELGEEPEPCSEVVACLSPSKKEIALGEKLIEGGIFYACVKTKDGAVLHGAVMQIYEDKPSEEKCDGKYAHLEKFKDEGFVKKCLVKGDRQLVLIVGCLTPLGKEVALHDVAVEGSNMFYCDKTANGVRLSARTVPGLIRPKRTAENTTEEEAPNNNTEAPKTEKEDRETEAPKAEEDVPNTEAPKTVLCKGLYKSGERVHIGNFIKKCTTNSTLKKWFLKVDGCLTPEKKEIDLDSSLEEGNIRYKCIKNEQGAEIKKENLPVTCQNGTVKEKGEYYAEDNKFIMRCVDYDIGKITACVIGEEQYILVGKEKVFGGVVHRCTRGEDGAVAYTTEKIVGCYENKKMYPVGEIFFNYDGRFKYKCLDNNKPKLIFCYVEYQNEKVEIREGFEKQLGEYMYTCFIKDGFAAMRRKKVE